MRPRPPRIVYLIRVSNSPYFMYHYDRLPRGSQMRLAYSSDPRKMKVVWRALRSKKAYSICNRLSRLGLARYIEVTKYTKSGNRWLPGKIYEWLEPGHKKASY